MSEAKTKFDREKVQAVLDLIADHGGPRGRADLPQVLANSHDMKFTRQFGRFAVSLGGLSMRSASSYADALDAWARAARRRLLGEKG